MPGCVIYESYGEDQITLSVRLDNVLVTNNYSRQLLDQDGDDVANFIQWDVVHYKEVFLKGLGKVPGLEVMPTDHRPGT